MKRIKITYFVVGLITLLLALALWPSIPWQRGSGDQLQNILSRGELRVSTLDSSQTYFNGNTGDRGFDYELASRFADYLGVKLVLSPHKDIESLFNDLKSNKADMLASGLIYNPERLKSFRTGPEYYTVSQQVLYRQGSVRPKSFADLSNNLVVSAGAAHITTLEEAKKSFPDLDWGVTHRYSPAELMQQVAQGKLKYTLGDSVTVALLQRVYPRLAVAFDATEDEPVTWYFNKKEDDDSLYAAMLDFYSQISEDGTLERLEEKYLGHVGEFDFVDTRAFLNSIDAKLNSLQPLFEKYADKIDWRLLAAISYQESHWDPSATSPTGVRGMMMLTRATAQGLGVANRLDTEESIRGGALYLNKIINTLPTSIADDDKIWFALAAYNMGYGHMLDARAMTAAQKGNPDSWVDVKQRLPMLNQKRYYSKTTYGYARGTQAFNYVENIRKYQISLVGYLLEKEKQKAAAALLQTQMAAGYPAVNVQELAGAGS
ncbi:membrane-bound lytic murein transglycosylase MltF [Rouxiella sp. T17]|uniref:membrane-bound lytic murein transglycosylase MltF n=1 Tax=Rouxiella sp. T17 TaxID=3085684 RepID=UPI002FC655FE